MKSLDWICMVNSFGHLPYPIRKQIDQVLHKMASKRIKVTISEVARERSLNQNAYYWGVVVMRIQDWMQEHGNVVSKEDVHEYLKNVVMPLRKEFTDADGEVHSIPRSTSELSTGEFEDYLENLRRWAAERDLIIPLPNEMD